MPGIVPNRLNATRECADNCRALSRFREDFLFNLADGLDASALGAEVELCLVECQGMEYDAGDGAHCGAVYTPNSIVITDRVDDEARDILDSISQRLQERDANIRNAIQTTP